MAQERTPDEEAVIRIEDLVFEYRRDDDGEVVSAVDHVNLEVERGSFTAIIGRNGSGKSTLAKNINALLLPSGGAVYVGGYDTRDESRIWDIRQMAGMVFQNPDNQLVSAIVEDDVAFGPENLGVAPGKIRDRVDEALQAVNMYEFRTKAPHNLSGGQKQRVAIAGVVAMRPKVIIFDEPTAMLDPHGRDEVMEIIERLHREGKTILLITHFMEEAARADRVVIMDRGKIVLSGTPTEVFAHGQQIKRMNLSVPFAVEMAERLRKRGVPIPEGIIDVKSLAGYLIAPPLAASPWGEKKLPEIETKEPSGSESSHMKEPSGSESPRIEEASGLESSSISESSHMKEPSGSEAPRISVEVRNLTHVYGEGTPFSSTALSDVSFDMEEGEFVGLIGHTGSGKSTLIQELNGLLSPKSGKILVDGVDITDKGVKMRDIRRKIGLVFQYPEYQLFEETVEKDVCFGPLNLGLSEEEAKERAREAIELVGLSFEQIGHRSPFELSGGQKRRVAIAGVIAMKPRMLILDEPTAGLDPKAHGDILNMVKTIHQAEKNSIVFVSHNMGDVAALADKVLVMDQGKLVMCGTPEEVFSRAEQMEEMGLGLPPATAFMRRLRQGGASVSMRALTADQAEEDITNWLRSRTL